MDAMLLVRQKGLARMNSSGRTDSTVTLSMMPSDSTATSWHCWR